MDEVFELERDVMQLHVRPGKEVHGVMIGITAHETEEIPDPVRHAKAEHLLVESDGALNIGREEGDVPELERADAGNLLVLAEITPFLEQLDSRALVIVKRQHLADSGYGIVAQLDAHAILRKFERQFIEVAVE